MAQGIVPLEKDFCLWFVGGRICYRPRAAIIATKALEITVAYRVILRPVLAGQRRASGVRDDALARHEA
jgi:hypothetical protein